MYVLKKEYWNGQLTASEKNDIAVISPISYCNSLIMFQFF